MTRAPVTDSSAESAPVQDLIRALVKGLRAMQLYLPNNPMYRKAVEDLRGAFRPVWDLVSGLELDIAAEEITWDGMVVYQEAEKAESLAWLLFKDGLRWLRLEAGVESDEVIRLMEVLRTAQHLSADAEDDLLTLLWEADLSCVSYRFVEPGEQAVELGPARSTGVPDPRRVQGAVDQALFEPEPQAVVDLEEFDASLYTLDEHEIEYLRREIEREYRQDLRTNVLSILFDTFERESATKARSEVLKHVGDLIPVFLGQGDFRAVAYLLRELRVIASRAEELLAAHRREIEDLPARLSEPKVFRLLLDALDRTPAAPTEEELGAFFAELRPSALGVAVARLPRIASAQVRSLLDSAIQRVGRAHPEVLSLTLQARDHEALLSAIRLVKWLRVRAAASELGKLLDHDEASIRVEVVGALGEIGTAKCLDLLRSAVDDPVREVRIAAVRVYGNRRDRRVLPRIQDFIAHVPRGSDMTERLAFFEAYGQISGAGGLDLLSGILHQRGFMRREEPDNRACAAMGLAKIGSPEARTVLERATGERDPVVKSAVRRALGELSRRR